MGGPSKKYFDVIQAHCLAKAGVIEDDPWGGGHYAWKVRGKIFAMTGAVTPGVSIKASLEKQAMLVMHPNIEPASYVGRYGWVTVQVEDDEVLELTLGLIDEAYDSQAKGKRKVTG